MKKMLVVFAMLTLSLALVACGPSEATAKGYGLVHKIYVGEVEVTVNKDGEVLEASIEEYYLPYNIAVVSDPADGATDVIMGNSHGDKAFAKYFKVGDILFTGSDAALNPDYDAEDSSSSMYAGLPAYVNADGDTILEWVAIEANAKAYVEGTQDGTVFIANADGTKHATYATPEGDQWTKSATGYGNDSFVWADQMADMEEAFVEAGVDSSYFQNDDNKWVVGDFVSGATAVDFADYYAVAKRAVANAEAEL